MFDMEADRIRDLSFDPKIIESERGVVASERLTRTDNSNFGLLFEQLNAAAYTAHPVRLARCRLAIRYQKLDDGRSEGSLPHGLRP